MQWKVGLFGFLFWIVCGQLRAQHVLQLQAASEEDRQVLQEFSYQNRSDGPDAAGRELKKFLGALWEEGYLLADTLKTIATPDTTQVVLSIGAQYRWARLSAGNVEPAWLGKTAWRSRSYSGKPFRYQQVARLMQELLAQAENSGYPFAALRLDSVQLESTFLEAGLQMEKGPYISFDTVEITGNARLSPRFLAAHLGIKPGQAYSEKKIAEVSTRLASLPYIRLQNAPKLSFQNRQATLYLDLADKRSNVFDGIVGILPDPQGGKGMLVTGQVDLLLQNPFRSGKRIELHWQRLNESSQNLEAAYYHPYVLGSPVSFDVGFSLIKEAESFVNREFSLEVQLRQGSHSLIRLIARQKDARLLSEAEQARLAGFSLMQYGLGFSQDRLNDPLLPRKGYRFHLDLLGGQKNIRSLPFGADPASGEEKGRSMQYRATGSLDYYVPAGPRLVWAHRLEGGLLHDKRLFLNDLYRLGGLMSLRGFREKNFFSSNYLLSRMEIRYIGGDETYFFLFYDQGLMKQMAGNLHVNDWPLGTGAGLSLGTSSGTFNFVYGIGKSRTQPLSFTNSQVHFGYVNRF